jgi:hypothetical protein
MVLGESVEITRIQPTPKSFRVDTGDVVTLQAVDCWKSCAAQDSSERSPASSGCVRQMHVRRAHAKGCVLQPSSTAARVDRSAARRAVGGVAGPGSAQTKKEVSVHQGSLIRKACLYVQRASHHAQQFAAVKAIASGLHSACFP